MRTDSLPPAAARPPVVPPMPAVAPAQTASSPAELTAAEAHARLRAALGAVARAERLAVLLFIVIARRHLYRELNYSTMIHYSTEALGLSETRARYFLRLARALEDLPAIAEALEEGRIGWTHAVQVAGVATPETEAAWLEQAETSSRRQLERTIKRARRQTRQQAEAAAASGEAGGAGSSQMPLLPLAEAEEAHEPQAGVPPAKVSVTFQLSAPQYARLRALQEAVRKSRRVPRGWTKEEVLLAGYEALLGAEVAVGQQPAAERKTPVVAASEGCRPTSRAVASRGTEDGASSRPEADTGTTPGAGSRLNSAPSRVDQQPAAEEGDGRAPSSHTLDRSRLRSRPHWQVVVHLCEQCGRVEVAGPGGEPLTLTRAEAERVLEDCELIDREGRRKSSIPPRVRRLVLERDGRQCVRCGAEGIVEVHHRLPREEGGNNAPENLVTLCRACHTLEHERRARGRLGGRGMT